MKLLTIIPILFLLVAVVNGLRFEVNPYRMECVYYDIDIVGSELSGSYLIKAPSDTVKFEITDPKSTTLFLKREDQSRFAFGIQDIGRYSFCFTYDKAVGSGSPAVVTIDVNVDSSAVEGTSQMTPLEEDILELSTEIGHIQSQQRFMRRREKELNLVVDSTKSRVIGWGFVTLIAIIIVSIIQIVLLRKLFN
ncbi:Transmembrane emp24 domain-containing protein like protein [Aduncisulcus paluster]|uniref:Transmembrane emp24 domain-containing protein like protein n=1 Tax=Aduncisulcus paluster TaxID=2918883 RepID=A0ABQ5KVJ3_9EUKA|nr:Transmembrane emp24 domain-containing protein like protein [Aduncisulcus paluster]|eukprot:gnl/Carplike_NY0171/3399_a4587_525.p1 GENE.gnl/Carplike_NY0171/3399_a4587_525~~gnl/Carplike_NY0171/3399_a4587_525.p1  ORF type:complete len:193 (-),score=32.72 gnl/Carplike_NY0171/3399_a4587_525:133-711(-)